MKPSNLFRSLVVAGASISLVVAVQPHLHRHRHAGRHAKRVEQGDAIQTVTATAYADMSGMPLDSQAVAAGLANGRLVLVSGKTTVAAQATPPPQIKAVVPNAAGHQFFAKESEATKSSSPAPTSSSSSSPDSDSGSGSYGSSGLDREFADGSVDCSHFPSDYGASPVEYLKLGGWTGVQDGNQGFANGPPGSSCSAGKFCSYACPAGYQKSQWPVDQGSLGQSVGGLKCGSGNKLHLTNAGLSKKLCIKGVGGVSIVNKLGKGVAVCRTDYPGTEGETIPATFDINAKKYDLTVPEETTYYKHQGLPTSAQYYINPAGASLEKACVWGNNETAPNLGNWAPLNIGTGQTGGTKWLGILPNAPTNGMAPLGFRVRIVGQGISDKACYYEYPNICSGSNCISVLDTSKTAGCTAATSGEASYEFY